MSEDEASHKRTLIISLYLVGKSRRRRCKKTESKSVITYGWGLVAKWSSVWCWGQCKCFEIALMDA